LLNINVTSSLDLNSLQKILQDEFKFSLPVNIQGRGNLSLNLENRFSSGGPPKIDGSLGILNASLKLKEFDSPFENINGRLEFNQQQFNWSGLSFRLQLTSAELFLESNFGFKDRLITLSKCSGQYINSRFLIQADIVTKNLPHLDTIATGALSIDLKDIKGLYKKLQKPWEGINPSGIIDARFKVNGNLGDIKSCMINVSLSSPSISIYGLKSQDLSLNYNQENGLLEISSLTASLYDGTIEAAAK